MCTLRNKCVYTRAPHAFVDTRALQRVCMQKYEIGGERVANWPTLALRSLTHSPGYNGQQRTALRQSACGGEDPRCSRRPPLLTVGICARNFRLIAAARRELKDRLSLPCVFILPCSPSRSECDSQMAADN